MSVVYFLFMALVSIFLLFAIGGVFMVAITLIDDFLDVRPFTKYEDRPVPLVGYEPVDARLSKVVEVCRRNNPTVYNQLIDAVEKAGKEGVRLPPVLIELVDIHDQN